MLVYIRVGMRHKLIPLAVIAGLLSLGCAEERPVASLPQMMPATPISSPLVAALSAPVIGQRMEDSTVLVDFGERALAIPSQYVDVAIDISANVSILRDTLRIQKPTTSEWLDIRQAFPMYTSFSWPIPFGSTGRLLSQMREQATHDFIDARGIVRLLAPRTVSIEATLVEYLPEYFFATVHLDGRSRHSSISRNDDVLYCLFSNSSKDTLVALDLQGTRLWALGIEARQPSGSTFSSAFDGATYWINVGISGGQVRLLQMDTSGEILSSIPSTRSMSFMSYWNRSLFYCTFTDVYRIDVDSSLSTNTIVAHRLFQLPPGNITAMEPFEDGIMLAILSSSRESSTIVRLSFEGELLSEHECYAYYIDGMSWDGESLWALHHGKYHASTSATLLSRFSLE